MQTMMQHGDNDVTAQLHTLSWPLRQISKRRLQKKCGANQSVTRSLESLKHKGLYQKIITVYLLCGLYILIFLPTFCNTDVVLVPFVFTSPGSALLLKCFFSTCIFIASKFFPCCVKYINNINTFSNLSLHNIGNAGTFID